MLHILYQITIYPIELLLGIVFSLFYEWRHDVGLSIIGVSVVVNLLLLPLYNRADKISEDERVKQVKMKPYLEHIKKTFKSDERFMMLQAYYRKMDYHPLYSLRSSLPLLLQVPFFIAAYHFLTNLSWLDNMSFLWIKNLSQADEIIVVPAIGFDIMPEMVLLNGFKINILPIIMTLINIISVFIYTKGTTLKEKLQLYIMAILFLVLLYNSPSGLVVYWTMNNVFSLIKNIVSKVWKGTLFSKTWKVATGNEKLLKKDTDTDRLFVLGTVLMTILLGILIPSSVVVSSPGEFISKAVYRDPVHYVFSTTLICIGFFIIWIPVFYYLSSRWAKRVFSFVLLICSEISLIDFFFFGKVSIYISPELKYDTIPQYSEIQYIINLIVLIAASLILGIILYKRNKWIKTIYVLLIIGITILSCVNVFGIEKKVNEMAYLKADTRDFQGFSLSKNGKNVIVIMLDRGVGTYIPFIFAERPELKDTFSGFTYYSNVISHGEDTLTGAPALFGGYEYTPESVNKRADEKLVDKHNEALKLMPVIFSENGFKTSVYDPPLAGYEEISDLSIYDEYPDIHAYSMHERFVDPEFTNMIEEYRKRTFFMYSIYKTVPLIWQNAVYGDGKYHYPDHKTHLSSDFIDNYSALKNLTSITEIDETEQNTFMMMNNELTHWPGDLQLPDYTLEGNINNRGLETDYRTDENGNTFELDYEKDYYANIAAFLLIGDWLDYLKANDVYNNTRIIIASDHGYGMGQFENLVMDDGVDMQWVIPIYMVKDFDSEVFTDSSEFMTCADTPTLAMKGLINGPINPFTNKRIDNAQKSSQDQIVLLKHKFIMDKNLTKYDGPEQVWYKVHDNVYDRNNWTRLSEEDYP